MWLECSNRYSLIRYDSNQHVIPWRVDVKALADMDTLEPAKPDHFTVGRILADELRRDEISEWGDDAWEAADADSSGLEAAYASLLDENGKLRESEAIRIHALSFHGDFHASKSVPIHSLYESSKSDMPASIKSR